MKTGKVMIGSCSSAGRDLKTKRSSAAGKTLATTCKTKKATAKTKPASKAVVKKSAPKPVVKKATVKPVAKKVAKKRVVMLKPKAVTKSTTKKEEKKYIPYSGPVNSFRDFNEYARKRIEQYPELKQDIVDLYYLAKEEIEDGNSEQNEVSLGYNSIEDIIKGNVY